MKKIIQLQKTRYTYIFLLKQQASEEEQASGFNGSCGCLLPPGGWRQQDTSRNNSYLQNDTS